MGRKKKKKDKKNKKESKKYKDEDDTKKQLQKILLDRLEKGDNDPKLLDLAMQLLGPEKTKPKASNPKSDESSDSPHSRNVIADGENFTVTVGAGGRRDSPRDRSPPPPSSKRKVTASRGRSRSRSKSPAVQAAKKRSIKERLGPVSDTEKPTFKNEHNGGGRNTQRSSSKDRKRDRDSGSSSSRDRKDFKRRDLEVDSRKRERR